MRLELDMRVACANVAKHTPQPMGYLSWHEWAEKKAKTHFQVQCPTCELWTIWKRKPKASFEPPRISGEGTAVNGLMPLEQETDA